MATIIPIVAATLEIIEKLNDGFQPIVTVEDRFFVYRGSDQASEIISFEDLQNLPDPEKFWEQVTILYSE